MDYILSEDGIGWMTLVSTVIAAVGLVVGIVIAVNTNRVQRGMHEQTLAVQAAELRRQQRATRHERKAEIRHALSEFHEACSSWTSTVENGSADSSSLRRRGQALITAVEAAGGRTTALAAYIGLVQGQASWIGDPGELRSWLESTAPAEEPDDADWAAGILNSWLDVVKDHVLLSTRTEDEAALLAEEFWTSLTTTAFADTEARKTIRLHASAEMHQAARARWLPADAAEDAIERIDALIRFTVLAENALALAMYGTFSNRLQDRSRDTKVVASSRHVMSELSDEVSRCADQEIARIEAAVEAPPAAHAG